MMVQALLFAGNSTGVPKRGGSLRKERTNRREQNQRRRNRRKASGTNGPTGLSLDTPKLRKPSHEQSGKRLPGSTGNASKGLQNLIRPGSDINQVTGNPPFNKGSHNEI
ncbi:hypothetical protein E2C01_056443 [Portunus trituberculatus]|uniref:Uncharacterized protein n=1 Tax=Portunus trituberculatus TaxID=210409 RepID=A0A5B7GXP7_PORTR|nr:hypothetical protein [Portunus trituberculatus]